jgi:hypothetical protein
MAVSVQKFIAPSIFSALSDDDVLDWNDTKWLQFIIAGQLTIGLAIFLCTWMGRHGNGF